MPADAIGINPVDRYLDAAPRLEHGRADLREVSLADREREAPTPDPEVRPVRIVDRDPGLPRNRISMLSGVLGTEARKIDTPRSNSSTVCFAILAPSSRRPPSTQ